MDYFSSNEPSRQRNQAEADHATQNIPTENRIPDISLRMDLDRFQRVQWRFDGFAPEPGEPAFAG